jgi:hypothetical protein
MNPISRVKNDARIRRTTDTMERHPELAVLVADCISAHAEIELNLGKALAAILKADLRTAMAMYTGVQNRAAQGRMIHAAVQASSIPQEHKELFNVLHASFANPAMKQRDRLAHWVWGYSPDIPDALLFFEPTAQLEQEVELMQNADLSQIDMRNGFVLTKKNLEDIRDRLRKADRLIRWLHWVLRPRFRVWRQ